MLRLCFLAALFALAYADPSLMQMRRLGFDQDHKAFSHEIVVPWVRPFKSGYCESWEWHTDDRYKQRRTEICRSLGGGKRKFYLFKFHSFVELVKSYKAEI